MYRGKFEDIHWCLMNFFQLKAQHSLTMITELKKTCAIPRYSNRNRLILLVASGKRSIVRPEERFDKSNQGPIKSLVEY
jgi:hypothetical protein